MSYGDHEDEDLYDDESWDDPEGEGDDAFPCPECGAEVHADAEACGACGYWIAEADRKAAWRKGSASGRLISVGMLVLGAAAVIWLLSLLR